MFPDQQNQNGGQPQQPYQQPAGPAPQPQQAPNGQYDVLPPLPVGQNTGHSGHNPYEFIVNPQTQKVKSPMFGGNKFFLQIAVIAGGVIVLLIVAAVVISALSPKSPTASVTALAQRQQEIIRVAALGTSLNGQDTKNYVANVVATMTSEQNQATAYLTAHNVKLKPKTLALDQDSTVDTLITNAQSSNTVDKAMVQALTAEITTYQGLIKSTFKSVSSKEVKAQLQQDYNASAALQTQAQSIRF